MASSPQCTPLRQQQQTCVFHRPPSLSRTRDHLKFSRAAQPLASLKLCAASLTHKLHQPGCSLAGRHAQKRRTVVTRAGDSDVPEFKGFPPMQTKPAFYWRILSFIPYILPLCEVWIYAESAMQIHPFIMVYERLARPVLGLLSFLPGWFMLAYFFVSYLGIVRNNRWPHFFRFHVVSSMLMEISIQVAGTMNDWLPMSLYWGKIGAHFWLAVTFAFIFIVMECMACAVRGTYADVPFISDAAYIQIPYE